MEEGFIMMYRSILKWEWYDDTPTKVLFLHLLLTVNYTDGRWHGIEVKKGCRITSLSKLSKESGLTLQQVRTALSKLKSTQEVTQFQHTDYTFIQVNNWYKYQGQSTQLPTQKQHRSNTEVTTIEKGNKEIKKDTNTDVFDSFWTSYPVKQGKKKAREVYKKLEKEHDVIMLGLQRHIKYWSKRGKTTEFIPNTPHPTTFLNERRWEDELEITEEKKQSYNPL